MKLEFLTPDDKAWVSILEQTKHDFYHLPGYVQLCANEENGTPEALLVTDHSQFFFLPYIIKKINNNISDIVSPYGYPGPLCKGQDSFVGNAISLLCYKMKSRNICCAFIRLNPLLPIPQDPLSTYGKIVTRGETVFVNLNLSKEEMWKQTRSGHRNNINKAKREGFVPIMDQWEYYEQFKKMYLEAMNRIQASSYYYFSPNYFTRLKQVLGDNLHLCTVVHNNELACAALFGECKGIVQYHLSASADKFAKISPNKFMLDFVRVWARERGNHVLHLGGGNHGGTKDSLFWFKAGFSKQHHVFSTWEIIFMKKEYEKLMDKLDRNYFQAYRNTTK